MLFMRILDHLTLARTVIGWEVGIPWVLCLCTHVTLILAYYRPSAYRLRCVPYLLPIQSSCVLSARLYRTLQPAHHPVLLYRYLASVASNATWWLPYMAGDFPTNIWLRSLIIFWSCVDHFASDYQVLFGLLSASVRHLSMLISKQITWVSHLLQYHHSESVRTSQLISDSLWITSVDYWFSWIVMYIRTSVLTSLSSTLSLAL